jgi:hypothetical protein
MIFWEVAAVFAYCGALTLSINRYLYLGLGDKNDNCLKKSVISTWAGDTFEWYFIESIVAISYLTTMIILLMKSRFSKVGVD